MGREISYICDSCGVDTSTEYYIVSIVKHSDETLRFQYCEDDPILCPECFSRLLGGFCVLIEGVWAVDEDEREF